MHVDACRFGDCRESMRAMIDEGVRVQTCVTSPPYWGLRDYGTATWEGGDAGCQHRLPATGSTQNKGNNNREGSPFVGDCGLCGAQRIDAQIGLETTPDEYVAKMVEVFRLVRDLLADDGTLWLNLGDSYNANQGAGFDTNQDGGARKAAAASPRIKWGKPKDLVGIPWRVAFALQADGWYLRSDIIWHKPNPMPESVTDRPTKAHEYLFLLSKRDRYFYDADAIREPAEYGRREWSDVAGNLASVGIDGKRGHATVSGGDPTAGRNRRTVWTVATAPYSEAHFATFPRALIEPCILAGSRVGDIVFDPFLGSGTTAQVAQDLGRRWLGCELNPAYGDLQKRRSAQTGLVLA